MANTLAKNVTKVLALLLAMVMLFASCGGNKTNSDGQQVDDNGSVIDGDNNGDGDNTNDGNDASGSDKTTSGSKSNKNKSKKGSKGNNGGSTSKETKWSANYLSKIPSSVKKKEIHVLMWRKYDAVEKKTVEEKQKATGIKVRTTVSSSYSTKLAQLIAGKDNPDVVCLEGTWPGTAINCLQPLDKYKFRLDDSIWSKTAMSNVMVNGKYYGVAIDGSWSCDDTYYCTFYAPSVLTASGITTDPWTLYKQGKWNLDAAKGIAKTFYQKSGNKKKGIVNLYENDLYMLASGYDFLTYKNGTYTNNLNDKSKKATIVNAWKEAAQETKDKLLSITYDATVLNQGNTALFNSISYGLYSQCDWFSNITVKGGKAGLRAVPMAGPSASKTYVPYRPKCWGVAKGSDNVEGAAYFLRYFLDPKTNGSQTAFGNNQFKEVFNVITGKNKSHPVTRVVRSTSYVMDYQKKDSASDMFRKISAADQAQVETQIDKYKGTIDSAAKSVNSLIKKRAK